MDLTGWEDATYGDVARADSTRGEVVLRRRSRDGALELRVNGVFVMDTAETSTERRLARAALDAVSDERGDARALIGGLGLGFTLAEVLSDRSVSSVVVAEIEPALVAWHRQGLVPETILATQNHRVRLAVGDVRDVVAEQAAGSLDLILLDVDNGPGYLVYDDNAAVYRHGFLSLCRRATRPGGVTAVWSADASDALAADLARVFDRCQHLDLPVQLGTRETSYHLYLGRVLP